METLLLQKMARQAGKFSCQPGLPDGLFAYKNTNLGLFWMALEWNMLVYVMVILDIFRLFGPSILWPFGNLRVPLVYFGVFYHQKSDNPVQEDCYLVYVFYDNLVHIFYENLVYFMVIWNIFPRLGFMCNEKSGNTELPTFFPPQCIVFLL
jgi:hypothetical protein